MSFDHFLGVRIHICRSISLSFVFKFFSRTRLISHAVVVGGGGQFNIEIVRESLSEKQFVKLSNMESNAKRLCVWGGGGWISVLNENIYM